MPRWSRSRYLKQAVAGFLALGALVGILLLTLTPNGSEQYQLSIIPFAGNSASLPHGDVSSFLINTAGNVVLFMPLGMFVPLALPGFRRLGKITLFGGLLSLGIETAQYFLPFGRFASTTDLILNTTGTALGYVMLRVLAWLLEP